MKLTGTLTLALTLIALNTAADNLLPARVPDSNASVNGASGPVTETQAATAQIAMSEAQINALGIKTGSLTKAQKILLLQAPAKVIIPPNKENMVSASQGGLVTKIAVAMGDKVNQGQLLAQINSPDLLNLQRQYLKAANELRLAESIYQRDQKMADSGIIADSRLQESRSRHQALSAETHEARQLLRLAGMTDEAVKKLDSHRQLNSLLNVVAPISGIVLDTKATVGSRVDNQAPLFHIADISELWLELNIPQEKINAVHLGDEVSVDDLTVTATISLLGQSVDPRNQTVPARAMIQSPQNEVRPGQSLKANVLKKLDPPAFKLPNEAIARHQGRTFVFVRNEQGFFVQPVSIIGTQDNEAFFNADFPDNSLIALSGAAALKANWLGLGSED